MDPVIKALKSSSSKEMVEKLTEFNAQHIQSMSLEESLNSKKQMIEGLFRVLRDTDRCEHHLLCLSTLRIMTRDSRNLDVLFTADRIETMLHLGNLVGEEEAYMTNASKDFDSGLVVEAQKCLCNLIFNNQVIQRLCCHNSSIDGIMLRMKMYKEPSLPLEVKYFDMRMLFLLTALCPDVRPKVRDEYHGLVYLMETVDLIVKSTQDPSERNMKKSLRKRKGSGKSSSAARNGKQQPHQQQLHHPHPHPPHSSEAEKSADGPEEPAHYLTDDEVNLIIEVLKVLFNLTCNLDRKSVDEIEEAHYMRLVAILHDLLLSETRHKERREEIQSHTINLLTNMPTMTFDELLVPVEEIGKIDNPLYEYEDMNVEAIAVILEFLEKRLTPSDRPLSEDRTMHESLAPVLICLSEMARAKRVIRKYLKSHILPPLKDVHSRPEDGQLLRNKLVKLMTTPNTDVKELVADFLFVLCKESVGRLIKYAGYGNAAGLLARRGLMMGGRRSDQYSSESEDSDTDEYLQYKDRINPVVGCYESPKENPLEGMSDEQKEHEAMHLVQLMDKITRAGIVKPCKIGEDGKPHPVDHILQLQEGIDFQAKNSDNGDSD